MILRAKILLLWLLTLAIPVQGFAAVLQACAPAMAHSASAHEAQTPHKMAGMHHHAQAQPMQAAMHQQHEHHAGHDMSSMQMADAAHDLPSHSHHAQHKSSCSYCAACTTGAVLPLALNAPPTPNLPSREFIALPTSGFVGYLPENPDRPPALI